MTEETRGPGRPAKPKLVKIKLLKGYVPHHIPADKMPRKEELEQGVLPKAAAGSVIEELEDPAKALVRRRGAEVAFDDEPLDWMSPREKKAREFAAQRNALERRTAEIAASRQASRELSKLRNG